MRQGNSEAVGTDDATPALSGMDLADERDTNGLWRATCYATHATTWATIAANELRHLEVLDTGTSAALRQRLQNRYEAAQTLAVAAASSAAEVASGGRNPDDVRDCLKLLGEPLHPAKPRYEGPFFQPCPQCEKRLMYVDESECGECGYEVKDGDWNPAHEDTVWVKFLDGWRPEKTPEAKTRDLLADIVQERKGKLEAWSGANHHPCVRCGVALLHKREDRCPDCGTAMDPNNRPVGDEASIWVQDRKAYWHNVPADVPYFVELQDDGTPEFSS